MTRERIYWVGAPVPMNPTLPGVWRFESRDRHLLTFRLWQYDWRTPPRAEVLSPTTETYTVPEATFWKLKTRVPASAMAGILDGFADDDVWAALTCIEVEALASIITEAGYEGVARRIVAAHSERDDFGDMHYGTVEGAA